MQTTIRNDGFTLLEVLVAMVVFTLGVLALFAMQVGAIKGNSQASNITRATTVALDQIEQVLSWDSNAVNANLADTNIVFAGAGADGANITADGTRIVGNNPATAGYDGSGVYTVYWDGTPVMDPVNVAQQVGIRIEVHVVWLDGTRQRQLTMNVIKNS